MNENLTFRELFKEARNSITYKIEGAILAFTEQVFARMEALQLKRARLAQMLETSPAYITKMLRGETNFTIESMVKVADALDAELRIEFVPKTATEAWVTLFEKHHPEVSQECRVWANNTNTRQSGFGGNQTEPATILNIGPLENEETAVAA